MRNPFMNIKNRRFLWPIIGAVSLILIVVAVWILYINRISDSEETTKQNIAESKKTKSAEVSAVAVQEDMLDREWALIALEKMALEKREEDIKENLDKIDNRYQQLEEQRKLLTKQEKKLEERNDEIRATKQNIIAERERLRREWQELEIVKEEKKRQTQQEVPEEPVEDKIAKEKQLKKMAKGFETMRARDAADILINMLEKDREDVLNLLRTMDDRTRTRIISAISRERVDTAADLTKELMEVQ